MLRGDRNEEKTPKQQISQQSKMSDTALEPTKKPAATKKNKKSSAPTLDAPAGPAVLMMTRLTCQSTATITPAQDELTVTESAIPLPPSPTVEQGVTRKDVFSTLALRKDFVDEEDPVNEEYVPGARAATPSMSLKQFGVTVNNLLSPQISDPVDKQPGASPSKKQGRSKDQRGKEGKMDEEYGDEEVDKDHDIFGDFEEETFQAQLAAATQRSLDQIFNAKTRDQEEDEEAKKKDSDTQVPLRKNDQEWDQAHMRTQSFHVVGTDPHHTINTMLNELDPHLSTATNKTAHHLVADIAANHIVGTADQANGGPDRRDAGTHRLQTIIVTGLLPQTIITVTGLRLRKDTETDLTETDVKPIVKSKPLAPKRQSIIPPVEPAEKQAPAPKKKPMTLPKKSGGLYFAGVTNLNRPRYTDCQNMVPHQFMPMSLIRLLQTPSQQNLWDTDIRNALIVGLYGDNLSQDVQKALIKAMAAVINHHGIQRLQI
ncbi:hypothetical protein C8J56DRAFT_888989 [Mycena floridula]|nr:hypothetical protein C8J56DRAFT_888989 [Mycena floridula]